MPRAESSAYNRAVVDYLDMQGTRDGANLDLQCNDAWSFGMMRIWE
jgi:hypothetical protein